MSNRSHGGGSLAKEITLTPEELDRDVYLVNNSTELRDYYIAGSG
jgi:hypothetical protein